jgi:hypothetical protein
VKVLGGAQWADYPIDQVAHALGRAAAHVDSLPTHTSAYAAATANDVATTVIP